MSKNTVTLTGIQEKIFDAFKTVKSFVPNYPTAGIKSLSETITKKDGTKDKKVYAAGSQEAANLFYSRKFSVIKQAIADGKPEQHEKAIAALKEFSGKDLAGQKASAFDTLNKVRSAYVNEGSSRTKVAPTAPVKFTF